MNTSIIFIGKHVKKLMNLSQKYNLLANMLKTHEHIAQAYNLFVTSKNETKNSPIHEFKVLHKGQRAF